MAAEWEFYGMNIRTISVLLASLLSVGLTAGESATPRSHGAEAKAAGLDSKTLHALDAAMQKQVDDKRVSGVIALIARHGRIGYYETFGHRVIERDAPMTKDTLFRIYSMTKPIVAVTVMALWEEGKFKLDDSISNYLPEWKDASVREDGEIVPAKSPVTARHLLTHTSGMSYDKRELKLGETDTLEEFSQSRAARPLEFHPGTKYKYGYSIDILGRFIEAIEGKSLDIVMRERVFDPLGMNDTEFWVKKSTDRDRVAMLYYRSKKGSLEPAMKISSVMSKPSRMMGGQGLMSTTGDYALFCQMLLNKGKLHGKRVLKKKTVKLMFKNHLEKIDKVYGLGGAVNEKGLYAWGGAAGTGFWVNHASDSYAVFMIQRWGYKVNTYKVFKGLAAKAIQKEREETEWAAIGHQIPPFTAKRLRAGEPFYYLDRHHFDRY